LITFYSLKSKMSKISKNKYQILKKMNLKMMLIHFWKSKNFLNKTKML